MNKLVELLQLFTNKVLLDEDENELKISLSKGASLNAINAFESKNSVTLPVDLKELLMFSDGLDLFGQKILSLSEIEFFVSENILSFHSWGNGDFDCISVNQKKQEETIYFMSHSVNDLTPVHTSLSGWVRDVISEIQQKGTLLHPYDFTERNEEGIYKSIVQKEV
nr:SMI1/KNR4 family protein [uncultured Draconibacterium sp.]